jgi:hypothetical protein
MYQFYVMCGVTQHPVAALCSIAHGVWLAGYTATNVGGDRKKFGGGEDRSLKRKKKLFTGGETSYLCAFVGGCWEWRGSYEDGILRDLSGELVGHRSLSSSELVVLVGYIRVISFHFG